MQATLTLKASTDTVAMFANYGVTDRFDVGLALPITHVDLDAQVDATILRLSSTDNTLVHTFVEGQDVPERIFSDAGSATGLGDMVVRTKYNFLRSTNTWMSLGFDLRLPSGDADNLLGLGTTQGKFILIASSNQRACFAPREPGIHGLGRGRGRKGVPIRPARRERRVQLCRWSGVSWHTPS